jgi:uncharacterized RDD family membrane protein YckC
MSYTYADAPPAVNVHVTGRRIVATIIDGIVLSVIYSLFRSVAGLPPQQHDTLDFTQLSTGGNIGWLLIVVLYYVLLEGLLGRTVGKLATGIKVISESDGRPPGVGRALLRTVLRLIDGLFGYVLGLIIVVNSARRRRLGDMAADTLVVRV